MRKCKPTPLVLIGCLILIITGNNARADLGDVALGGKIGTLGLGAELTVGLLPQVNARIGLNALSYTYDALIDDIDYEFDLNLLSASLLTDWHFFKGRLSANCRIGVKRKQYRSPGPHR